VGRIVACANQKGGVGKTTTVVNLGAYLALSGDRVLVVDLDPQGNATSGLGIDRARLERSVYDAVIGNAEILDLVLPTMIEGLSVVPSTTALAGAEVELVAVDDREHRFARRLLAIAPSYEHVLLDCPPSLGLLTVNALTAADAVLVPLQCEYYALEGMAQLVATINLVRDHLNPDLAVEGVLLTMFDARTRLSEDVAAEARAHLGGSVYQSVIPRSVRLSEAPSHGRPIARYRPDSKGALAYEAFAAEFRARSRRAGPGRAGPSEPARVTAAQREDPAIDGVPVTPSGDTSAPEGPGALGAAPAAAPASLASVRP
jgi:chromosome partitioning protein